MNPSRDPRDLALTILGSIDDGYQVISRDFRYAYLNDEAVRHSRTTREALLGHTMMEVFPGIENTAMFDALRRCMTTRVAARLENEFVYPDGRTCWFELQVHPVEEGLLIASRDIAARKQTEDELHRSRRVLTVISEANQALVRATTVQQFVQDVCRIAVEQGGYRMAWIGEKAFDSVCSVRELAVAGVDVGYVEDAKIRWDESPNGQEPTGRAIRTGLPVAVRFLANDPALGPWRDRAVLSGYASCLALPFSVDGRIAGALSIYSATPDAFSDHEVQLLTEVARDLGFGIQSLRHSIELRRSEDRYRTLVENLEDVVFSIDVEGRFTYVSRAVAKYGFVPADFVGQHFSRWVHEADLDAVRASMARTIAGAQEPSVFRTRDKQGVERVVRTASRLVMADGVPAGLTGVMIDVTELRHTEEQLRAAQKMEAIGQLAGGIAHDFNNLLSVILSYSGFVAEAVQGSTQALADVEEIRKAGERAASLTRQLLAFSRKQVLEPRVLDLNALTGELEKMLRRLIGEDIEFIKDFAPDLGRVKADPGQLEQVIMNLVVNARDAMPTGGKLTVTTTNTLLDEAQAAQLGNIPGGRFVKLSITDTGCGMDATTQRRVFEPFYTTKGIGKGTGLGLSTVYGIVAQSGGAIGFSSSVGVGTTFDVYLPWVADAPVATSAEGAGAAAQSGGCETILLVEDDHAVRSLAARALRQAGYNVLLAANGHDALALCTETSATVDLLLTDVVMPQMSGKQLADRLLQTKPQLCVLYMSGYTNNMIEQHGVLDPETMFIGKPFSPRELASRVRQVLDQNRG